VKFRVGDLVQSKFREEEDEVCLVLEIIAYNIMIVRRSRKRQYEKKQVSTVNPALYEVFSECR
tara:strand:+ start:3352 stop:3540 length:189 start_codon:yes stop_codon:yes gene_type:complete